MGINLRIELFARGLDFDAIETFQSLEDAEEKLANEIIDNFGLAVATWSKSIARLGRYLVKNSQETSAIAEGTDEWAAVGLRQTLLALSISSSKAALALLLSGHYSIAFAAIRHMIEISIQCFYLEEFPEQYRKWYDDPEDPNQLPDTPSVRTMCSALHDLLGATELDQESIDESRASLDALRQTWSFLSKGSHPTIVGVYQIENTDEKEVRFIEARPSYYHLYYGFSCGITASIYLAQMLFRMYPDDHDLARELQSLQADLDAVNVDLEHRFGPFEE